MVKGGKNESNTFGEGWGTFPPTPPPKTPDLGGIWGGGGDALEEGCSGRSEGKKGRVGEKGPARAQNKIVAPVHVARQGGPRHRRRGAALAWVASVATLSRHMHWRDRGYLSRRGKWRDQTGYSLQIKTNTG